MKQESRVPPVVLVGFDETENLGLRSLAAYLTREGIPVTIHPYDQARLEDLVDLVKASKPLIVGFSLIFQRMLFSTRDTIASLRERGIKAHMTIGGHYPSLADRETLEAIPDLDSVVRGEGEATLLALYRSLRKGNSLDQVLGLTWREKEQVRANPPRPLIDNLDDLPFPLRRDPAVQHRGMGVGSVVASRGCYFDCSFCSIHNFYRLSPGRHRRGRSPQHVVDELEHLHRDQGVRIFVFEDDDFLARGSAQQEWLDGFCEELRLRRLNDDIVWRASCRVDDVNRDTLERMREAGLMCLYVGIESGSEIGLATYRKHYKPSSVYRFIEMMESLDMPFEFGFMLFHPDCQFESVRQDIEFLRRVGKSGLAVVHFTKMLPYAGTSIADRLEKEERLEGDIAHPDYRFLDPRLDLLEEFCSAAFHHRNFDPNGAVERLRSAKFDVQVVRKFFSNSIDASAYDTELRSIIKDSNAACVFALSIATRFLADRSHTEALDKWELMERLVEQSRTEDLSTVHMLDGLLERVFHPVNEAFPRPLQLAT